MVPYPKMTLPIPVMIPYPKMTLPVPMMIFMMIPQQNAPFPQVINNQLPSKENTSKKLMSISTELE